MIGGVGNRLQLFLGCYLLEGNGAKMKNRSQSFLLAHLKNQLRLLVNNNVSSVFESEKG